MYLAFKLKFLENIINLFEHCFCGGFDEERFASTKFVIKYVIKKADLDLLLLFFKIKIGKLFMVVYKYINCTKAVSL